MTIQITATTKKYPPHERKLAMESIDEVTNVPVKRLIKVVVLIALARIVVEKISDGMTQPNGPIPSEKNARYAARPIITTAGLSCVEKNSDAISSNAKITPVDEYKKFDTVRKCNASSTLANNPAMNNKKRQRAAYLQVKGT